MVLRDASLFIQSPEWRIITRFSEITDLQNALCEQSCNGINTVCVCVCVCWYCLGQQEDIIWRTRKKRWKKIRKNDKGNLESDIKF